MSTLSQDARVEGPPFLPLPPNMADVKPDLQASSADLEDESEPTDVSQQDGKSQNPKDATEVAGWLCGFCGATFAHRSAFKVRRYDKLR